MKTKLRKLIKKLQSQNVQDRKYLREMDEAFERCEPEEQIGEQIQRAYGEVDARERVIRQLKHLVRAA